MSVASSHRVRAAGEVLVCLVATHLLRRPGKKIEAYPLALTYGTADTSARNIPSGSSAAIILSTPASMSGNAWSCIGYPPRGAGALSGSGSCLPPDAYPLHSDLGEVYIYQPYEVLDGAGNVWGNHIGSSNRGTFSIAPDSKD